MSVDIGKKIRGLRQKNGLTQQELADRCELSKGFISQLESDQTSPSLSTLEDILTTLGTDFGEFFRSDQEAEPVIRREDVFVKEMDEGQIIRWLIPDAQKKELEPILVELPAGTRTETVSPHEGEEFGHVLSGSTVLVVGEKEYRVRRGDSFSLKPSEPHYLKNTGKLPCEVLWVVTPPNF